MQTESEFNSTLKKLLEHLEYHKEILWWERLQAGRVQSTNMGWLQLCRKGTPDWIVVFYDKNKNLSLLFIEGKSDAGMNIKRESQDDFKNKYKIFKIIRTNSVDEIKKYISDNYYDPMTGWSEEVDVIMGIKKLEEEEF